jgi:glycosyltransferase involved in cell wall biosynthesis
MRSDISVHVTHYHRNPFGGHSVERLFAVIRAAFPENVECTVAVCRFRSSGVFRRLWNLTEAPLYQSQVNHITGDVHYLATLLHKRRTILTILDCGSLRRVSGLRRRILKLIWYEVPMWRSSVVVAISEFTKRELQELVPALAQRVIVIPVPLVGDFAPYPKEFNCSEPVILHIGVAPNKNIERVAQALRDIPCKMEIVGKLNVHQKWALAECGIKYSNCNCISDAEMVEKYRRADIVEFCSTYEGFGMPVIEANAIGRAVVTSNVCSLPEVAGRAACLVDPFDVESMRRGFQRVIGNANYRHELIDLGYKNAARYRADVIAQQYADLYATLIETNGAR